MTTLPEGVKATTGDRFDRDESFRFFIASGPKQAQEANVDTVLVAVNELRTKAPRDQFKRLLDEGRKVMLDSGVYNLAMEHVRAHNTSHNYALNLPPEEIDGFDELWDQYGEIVTTYGDQLWGAVELDQGGAEHKPRTRARIESEFGIVPIPVYHPLADGWDYYDTLAQGYDRLCFGNIVQAASADRLRLAYTAYRRAQDYPYLWTHLLGLYPNQFMTALRMRGSSDASAWLTPARWPPSWRAWAMTRMVTGYPSDMWVHSGTDDSEYDRGKIERICANTTRAVQMTLDDTLHDTHPTFLGGPHHDPRRNE